MVALLEMGADSVPSALLLNCSVMAYAGSAENLVLPSLQRTDTLVPLVLNGNPVMSVRRASTGELAALPVSLKSRMEPSVDPPANAPRSMLASNAPPVTDLPASATAVPITVPTSARTHAPRYRCREDGSPTALIASVAKLIAPESIFSPPFG